MNERLRAEDLAFLAGESATSPRHVATLEVFEPGPDGFDHDRLLALIEDRIAFVPRYRQRLRDVPGRLAPPVWVDDDDFDLSFHVRRSALPRPGSMAQLRELVARIVSRRLDRHRPLWEVYLVEGLEQGKFAVLSKSHSVLVDGISTVDLGQVLLDVQPHFRRTGVDEWRAQRQPASASLALDAVRDSVRHPGTAVSHFRGNAAGLLRLAAGAMRTVPVAGAATGRLPGASSPLAAPMCEHRRFATVRTDLDRYREVRRAHGGTVNDVVLATVTGGLRAWLMTRGALPGSRHLRAMVPMSVIDEELGPTSMGSQVSGHLLSLPVGENSPVVRLHQVSYALKAHRETGRAVAANRLAGVAGFAPATFHAVGSRVAAMQTRRPFDLVVTNVPGPQFPLYAAGARMTQSYPVPPLLPGRALAIGVTSYDGAVYFGLCADFDALPDVELLAQCVEEALAELVDTAGAFRPQAPRGRGPSARC